MVAVSTHPQESRFMRWGEDAVRAAVMVLVLTGQMLPSGSVSAQEGPQPPSVATPDQLPAPEAIIPPSAPLPEKIDAEAAAAVEPAPPVVEGTAPPQQPPASPTPEVTLLTEGAHQFGDWTMTIRPGIVTPRTIPHAVDPCAPPQTPQHSVSGPVIVNVNNLAPSTPYQFPWMWSVPATYPTQWNAPTSAYLFQRPRPYWKLRGDFHHLAPFIPGLWY